MSKQTPKQEAKEETADAASFRPVGLSISSFFYALSGIYYFAFPIVAQDTGAWHLYVIGAASLLGSFGVFRMARWGLWLGLLLFPLQIVAPASTLLTVVSYPGLWQQPIAIAFVASLFVLMFFASLTFLLVLDKRSEEHTSELQSRGHLVCRLLLEKKKLTIHLPKDVHLCVVQPEPWTLCRHSFVKKLPISPHCDLALMTKKAVCLSPLLIPFAFPS